ncbi:hypothetical protein CI109_103858 [Kwoniella shandongensis]|uniref:Uncharacterized protein n=1 Tax=Kwoniella shandongensis TaxID=1734106 RepID=A0AAJ8LIT1_9TREE
MSCATNVQEISEACYFIVNGSYLNYSMRCVVPTVAPYIACFEGTIAANSTWRGAAEIDCDSGKPSGVGRLYGAVSWALLVGMVAVAALATA